MLKGVRIDPASKVKVSREDHVEKLLLIRCECGAEILLVPDLKEMNYAIETHIAEHKKMEKPPMKAKITSRRIRQNLTQQAVGKAATSKQFGV